MFWLRVFGLTPQREGKLSKNQKANKILDIFGGFDRLGKKSIQLMFILLHKEDFLQISKKKEVGLFSGET